MSGRGDGLVISAHGVSKRFVSYRRRATSVKERFVRRAPVDAEDLWALRDVDVEIHAGETVGLIGANGAGKSTLLKVLAGILRPTTGEVSVHGRVASLLELGAGFNSELTGRENVYLNASLLGLTRKETERLFDDIVDFSEIGPFIDNAVKHYSSGMYVRLGFAVAVHVDPDVLLVDEVLAVGDEAFQRKCLAKIDEFQQEGRTILFVTHSLDLVDQLCTRAVVLEHGTVAIDGDTEFAIGTLRQILGTADLEREEHVEPAVPHGGIVITEASMWGASPEQAPVPGRPATAVVDLQLAADEAAQVAGVDVVVMGVGDIPVMCFHHDVHPVDRVGGPKQVFFHLDQCPPVHGAFRLAVGITDPSGATISARSFGHAVRISGRPGQGLVDASYVSALIAGPPQEAAG